MKRIVFSLILLSGFYALPGLVKAQTDVEVSATVLESLEVSAVQNLEFGDIVAGNAESVAPDEADAGRYDIQGENDAEVSLDFTLPTVLEHTADPSLTMAISFATDDAIHNDDTDASTGTSFDPNVTQTENLSGTGELFLFIGGTVESDPGQEPGNYQGTITLSVEYTAN